MEDRPRRPLEGVRVLDLATLLAGPFAVALLADFGADVIKVELPGAGDGLRRLAPFYEGHSLWWASVGRNKRSVTVDMRQPAGQEVILDLVRASDVVIQNFRPGTLDH